MRPKHHYLYHYGDMIRKFGPLGKCSTLRMESKHQFFKKSISSSGNYINISKSASTKHQKLQAFIMEGDVFQHDSQETGMK